MADGILGRIARAKRAELRARYAGVSLDALRAAARADRRAASPQRWREPGARFILEIKKASPSVGRDPARCRRSDAGARLCRRSPMRSAC